MSPGIDTEESIPPGWESILGLLKRFTVPSVGYIYYVVLWGIAYVHYVDDFLLCVVC